YWKLGRLQGGTDRNDPNDKKVGRTFLSVKNPAKRGANAASESSKFTDLAVRRILVVDGQECPSYDK
ncbi:MAG: hypothetical protein RL215_2986, partial [Planctomycetota bacterium]